MSRFRDRPYFRLALIGLAVVSLGLAGCGRKGPLDLPPGASVANEPQVSNPSLINPIIGTPAAAPVSDANPGVGANGAPLAPKGPKKTIPLDVLLN